MVNEIGDKIEDKKFIIAIGIAILYYAPGLEILGYLTIGSALFCYASSFYEMNLLEKRTKHELK